MPEPSALRNEALAWLSRIAGDASQALDDRTWASHLINETLQGEPKGEGGEPIGFEQLAPCVGEPAGDLEISGESDR